LDFTFTVKTTTTNNSGEAAAAQLEDIRDEIERIEESSVPVSSIITRLGDVPKFSPEWFQLKEQELLLREQHQAIIRRMSDVPEFSER
jgi:hypothetical protein